MFGSDWPVCNLAAKYTTVVKTIEEYITQLPISEQNLIWYGNANTFYKLDS